MRQPLPRTDEDEREQPMPNRKTVSVDVLRQLLGDGQTDELLEQLTPSKPTIPVDAQSLRLAQTLYADPLTDSRNWADTLPVVRRYFQERGQSRRAFLAWLGRVPAGAVDDGAAEMPAQTPRRRVTDPVPQERRRTSVSKARDARTRRSKS